MTPLEVIDKIARGDVYVRQHHVPRRADDRGDGADLRDAAGSARPRRSSRRRATRRSIQRPRSRARGSRGLSVSGHLRAAAQHRRAASSSRRWSSGSSRCSRRSCATRPKRAGLTVRQAGDAGVDRREGNRTRRGAAARGRGLREPPADRDGPAVPIRPSSTRCSAPGSTTATCGATICSSTRRTTPIAIPGLPPGPIAAPGKASLEAAAQPGRRRLPLLRQPQRRLARVRADARRAQPQRAEVSGAVLQRQRQSGR